MLIVTGSNKGLTESIVLELLKQILNGSIKPGDKVLSVREQAKVLRVNPQTIQKVYNAFVAEEVFISKRGSGNYLTTDQNKLSELRSEFTKVHTEQFITLINEYKIDKQYVLKMIKESNE